MSEDIQQTVRMRDLRLVDADGQERAILTTTDDGNVVLKLMDGDQQTRLNIAVGREGEARIHIGNSEPGNFALAVEKSGRILLEGLDSDGIQRFKLEMKENGSHTELSFSERNRKPRMILIAEDKGPAGLFILDQYGKALFSTTP